MKPHLERFAQHLKAERRYTLRSRTGYVRDAAGVLDWIHRELGRPVEPADLTLSILRAWQAACAADTPATLNRKISAVRAFCAYLRGAGGLSENPAASLTRPRVPHVLPLLLSQEQTKALCEAPQHGAYDSPRLDRVLRRRDAALLEVAYASGLRCAELAALRLDCCTVRLASSRKKAGTRRRVPELVIRVLCGKGGKSRTVVCRGAAVGALRRYLQRRDELAPQTDHLWVGAQGRPLAPPGIRGVVRRWGQAVGIQVHPHKLRHAFCSHVLERGAAVLHVQHQMGHSSLNTTTFYAQTAGLDLGDEVAAYHPRAAHR